MDARSFFVAMGCVLTAGVATARAQSVATPYHMPDFSATQVLQTSKYSASMQVYRSGASVRAQYTPSLARLFMPGQNAVLNLTRYPDGSRTCISFPLDRGMGLPNLLELLHAATVQRTPLGTEVIEGHPTRIERAVVTASDGRTSQFTVWLADDLKGVPVKIESPDTGMRMSAVYRDIVLGTPDRALFTPPIRCIPSNTMGQIAEHTVYK
jgi:hypothetical protein